MLKPTIILIAPILSALVCSVGCNPGAGTSNPAYPDASDVDTGPRASLLCEGDCSDFVVDQITLPASMGDINANGLDLDGNGSVDNAFARVLQQLFASAPDVNLPQELSESINKGLGLILMRVKAADLVEATTALSQAWLAAQTPCCNSVNDPVACATQARQTCFNGQAPFQRAAESPQNAVYNGRISGGQFQFGPGNLQLQLPIGKYGTLNLQLKGALFRGTLRAGRIEGGRLAGAIPQENLQSQLVPQIATMLNDFLVDLPPNDQSRQLLLSMLDTDKNGTVTADDLRGNLLIQSLLAGDIDVEGDGVMEMSFGIGFTAVGAQIQ